MTTEQLEQRMSFLERTVAEMNAKVDRLAPGVVAASISWWKRSAGLFEGDPLYEKAARYGREYRESMNLADEGTADGDT